MSSFHQPQPEEHKSILKKYILRNIGKIILYVFLFSIIAVLGASFRSMDDQGTFYRVIIPIFDSVIASVMLLGIIPKAIRILKKNYVVADGTINGLTNASRNDIREGKVTSKYKYNCLLALSEGEMTEVLIGFYTKFFFKNGDKIKLVEFEGALFNRRMMF